MQSFYKNRFKRVGEISFYILLVVCFFTNISQIPYFVENGITQYLSQPLWGFLFLWIVLSFDWVFSKEFIYLFTYYAFLALCAVFMDIFFQGEYLLSSIFINVTISILIFFVGCFFSGIDRQRIDLLLKGYVYSSFVVSCFVFFGYFWGKVDLQSSAYAYASKNSISLIILTAIIIIFHFHSCERNGNPVNLNLMKIMGIFLVIVLSVLRSRAVILALIIICFYFIGRFFILEKMTKRKALLVVCLVAASSFCFFIYSDFIFYKILLAGRNADSLNDISSGRVDIIMSFPDLINDKYMTGIGDIYFECYPLSVFLNFGIPFGTFVLILSCIPLWLVKGIKKKNSYYGLFMMIIFSYYTNSLFEGLAPVGPGAKCYFLWLLAGILYKNKSVEQ